MEDGLELTMAVPGLSFPRMREIDMNRPPAPGAEEEWPAGSVEEEEEESGNGNRAKKLRLSKEQSRLLEESFRLNHTLNPKQKESLAARLKLRPRQVEVWFQNRRARTKLKQTEMECEYLKRCFGSLTEENRRLQREVEELRAMRVAPPTVLSPHTREPMPASALTMCPRCERVTAAATTATDSGHHQQRGLAGSASGVVAFPRGPVAGFQPRRPSAAC